MPWKFLAIVLFLICALLIFYIWNPGDIFKKKIEEPPEIEVTPLERGDMEVTPLERGDMWVPFDFSGDGRVEVGKYIDNVKIELEQMSGELTVKTIARIDKFFRNSGYVETHDGTYLTRSRIKEYFEKEIENIDSIKFKLEWYYTEEDTDKLNLPIEQQKPTDVIHFVWLDLKLDYVYKGKPIDPDGGRGDRHIRNCHWIGY